MEFLIFIFGAIYVGIRLFSESVDKEVSRRQWAKRKAEEEEYKLDPDERYEVADMIKYDRAGCIERCKKYILPFAPDLDVSDDRLKTIMYAMNGHYEFLDTPVADWRLTGRSSHIQNQIEFWHQVENALHDAGKTNAKFYRHPPAGRLHEVTKDANGNLQYPPLGCDIKFGEDANIFQYCIRMW